MSSTSAKKKPKVYITRKLPDLVETRMRELFDADRALSKMLPEWRSFYSKAVNAGLSGAAAWAAVYFGHNQGGGALEKGLKAASQGIEAVVSLGAPARNAAAALRVALKVAAHTAAWAVIEDRVWAGQLSSALGSLVVDPFADFCDGDYCRRAA